MVNSLVVIDVSLHGQRAVQQFLQEGTGVDSHVFCMKHPIAHPVAVVPHNIGQMLVEGTPEMDIEHLCPPTHT